MSEDQKDGGLAGLVRAIFGNDLRKLSLAKRIALLFVLLFIGGAVAVLNAYFGSSTTYQANGTHAEAGHYGPTYNAPVTNNFGETNKPAPLDGKVLFRCDFTEVPRQVPPHGWSALVLEWGTLEGVPARGGDLQPSGKPPGADLNLRNYDPRYAPQCKIINFTAAPLLNVDAVFSVEFFQQNKHPIQPGVTYVSRGPSQGRYEVHTHNINIDPGTENAFEFFVFNDTQLQYRLNPPANINASVPGSDKLQTIKLMKSNPLDGDPGPKRAPPVVRAIWRPKAQP